MYRLLVKTHNQTGLKYLCKHTGTQESALKYYGSGIRWKCHLRKHGKDLSTQILFETNDSEELKTKGIYYSKLWNVVKSNKWANLCMEQGFGGRTRPLGWKHSSGTKRKMSLVRKNWHKNNEHPLLGTHPSTESKQKQSQTRIRLGVAKGKNHPMYGKKRPEVSKRMSGSGNPAWKGGVSFHYKKKLLS